MPASATTNPTLADVASRLDANGRVDKIVELLNETNEILADATFLEANDGTNNKTTIRTGLPNAAWRRLYEGIQPSKSRTAQVVDAAGMLEALSAVDIDLVDKAPDPRGFRLSEERPFFETMNQQMAETLFFGDTSVNPERFTGLAARYSKIDHSNKWQTGYNVIDAGGTGNDLTSIWLISWGQSTAHMFYPRGSQAGIKSTDNGKVPAYDDKGGKFFVYESHYKWDCGFSLRDWRAVVRIANIDITKVADGTTDLNTLLIKAIHRQKGAKLGRNAIYCNGDILTQLDLQTLDKKNILLGYKEVQGQEILSFRRTIPLRECEALEIAEDQVPTV